MTLKDYRQVSLLNYDVLPGQTICRNCEKLFTVSTGTAEIDVEENLCRWIIIWINHSYNIKSLQLFEYSLMKTGKNGSSTSLEKQKINWFYSKVSIVMFLHLNRFGCLVLLTKSWWHLLDSDSITKVDPQSCGIMGHFQLFQSDKTCAKFIMTFLIIFRCLYQFFFE